MRPFTYLAVLLFSLSGLGLADWRYRLAFWHNSKATVQTLGLTLAVFLTWDLLGVAAGIFFIGPSDLVTGLTVLPEVPVEEIFFLILLGYVTLITWRLITRQQEIDKP